MRLLVTFVGGLGHLAPLLPLARAARDAGHDVALAGSGGLVPHIEQAGFTAFATSPPPHHAQAPDRQPRTPLEVMDAHAAEVEFADNFADRGARRMAGAVPAILRDFRPDLVLRDETDLGTTIAAELHGTPVATHLVLASGMIVRPDLVAPRLDVVRAEHGLPADPDLTRLTSGPVLSAAAPSFRSPDAPLRVTDPVHYRAGATPVTRKRPGRTCVYATLGTIFNKGSGDLFERLASGLGALDADVLLTVGRDVDPADLGPVPARVRVERFVPHEEAVAAADVVVHHGGSGSLMAALAHGLPSVLLPLGADQPHNARRAHELGLAATLDAATATPAEVGRAVDRALADASMRSRCEAVAAELRALPDAESAVATLCTAAA
ncbi:glycosyl transferase [Nocardioides flavus (ex Wang et al. 2016)]|uniref:Glycosyl transferase n=1 Tax=Nocardioides flavus (ex Wang et al. 2016) TaxID=2058780 RepID=A0ABQ3HMG8_9ACTN|nr:glycosyltransferase [Nocardioides flavus (ex Wang et al. 2016)]GHE18108.1 glycosyl transferase [Nocardioides flavus (ex Wang et al. 2016)]